MVCDDVRRVAYFFLDGTLGESKRADFQSHIERCDDCESRVRFHEKVRDFLRKRLSVSAPSSLHERVATSLQGARASG